MTLEDLFSLLIETMNDAKLGTVHLVSNRIWVEYEPGSVAKITIEKEKV